MWTRRGTFIGAGLLIAWGTKFIYDQLSVYQGDQWWNVLVTTGVPVAFLIVFGTLAWRLSFSGRKTGDFMIATEGEMKKVSWSTRKEVVGSTIVVIAFTVLLAGLLFLVDLVFQSLFRWINVLKV
jgi:preprotein translocase subunit SecE